ncbi:hypothetical protein ACJ41O_010957 [Fusarium nematophilum]
MKFFIALSALASLAIAEITHGNWSHTCKDEELDGFTLKAKCKNIAGDDVDTSLDLNTCLAWSTAETNIVKQDGGNLSQDCSDCWLSATSYEGDEASGQFVYQLTCNCPGEGNPYWANIQEFLNNRDGQLACW